MTLDNVVARAIELCRYEIEEWNLLTSSNSNPSYIPRKKDLRSWQIHLAEFEEHSQMTRWLVEECGGSFASIEDAMDGWDESDPEYEEEAARLSTFTVCKGCGEREAEFADHLGIDEWTYSPLIYDECPIARDKAKRLMGEE